MTSIPIKFGYGRAAIDIDGFITGKHAGPIIGSFYESMACWLLGAEPWEGGPLYARKEDRYIETSSVYRKMHETPLGVTPDLLWRDRNAFVEVKASSRRDRFMVPSWQVLAYDRVHSGAHEPIRSPKIFYVFFTHGVRDVKKTCHTPRLLVEALTRRTLQCLVLELEVVLGIIQWIGVQSGYEAGEHSFPDFCSFTIKRIEALQRHPRECLDEIMGAKQLQFMVTKSVIGDGASVWGDPVEPFNVLSIRRRAYHKLRPPYEGPSDESWWTGVQQQEMYDKPEDPLAVDGDTVPWEEGDDLPF